MLRPRKPRDNRPSNAPRHSPAGPLRDDFKPMFSELMKTRWQYEALRASDGSLVERAALIGRMQELRADLARARRGSS